MTEETANQLESWLKYKHRTRRVCYKNKDNGNDNKKTITEYRTPTIKNTDLVFAVVKTNKDLILLHYIPNWQGLLPKYWTV